MTASSSAACPRSAGRPTLIQGKRQLLFGGMGRLTENSVVMMKNKSYSLTAEVTVPDGGAEGVIIAQGGVTGGRSFYVKDGKPKYCYNFFGLERYYIEGTRDDPAGQSPGAHGVRLRRRRRRQRRDGRRSTSTATMSARGASSGPRRSCSRPTRPATSATSSARRSRTDYASEQVHRRGQLGRDRSRARRPQPPDHAGGSNQLAMAIQ